MVVIGIDDNLLYNDFRIDHNELQCMLASGNPFKGGIEPAEVVEYFIAAGQLSPLPEAAQSQTTALW